MEKRWLSMSVQTGINAETVLLWFAIGGAAAALLFALFWAWNRALQQEIVQRQRAEKNSTNSWHLSRPCSTPCPIWWPCGIGSKI